MIGKLKVLWIDDDLKFDWYDEIDFVLFYEKYFEIIFFEKISVVYFDFIGISFVLKIEIVLGESLKFDLVIIRKDYKEWYIIEVEMGRYFWEDYVEK